MPHHFKWINRATLLFNLASAELVAGSVEARARARERERGGGGAIKDAQACLSLSRRDRPMDGTGRRMAGREDDREKWKTARSWRRLTDAGE